MASVTSDDGTVRGVAAGAPAPPDGPGPGGDGPAKDRGVGRVQAELLLCDGAGDDAIGLPAMDPQARMDPCGATAKAL